MKPGTNVYVKHENHNPTGAFKVRGGINLLANLLREERQRGVITASSGNHGQSIAFAARLFGVSGCCSVAKTINPNIRVIGVQAEKAPSAYLSCKAGQRVEAKMETFAEGLATRAPFDLPQSIMRELLDDFILVSEDEMREAMRLLIEHTRNLPEAAGAASLAAAPNLKTSLAGKNVTLMMSGGNITLSQLHDLLLG